MENLTNLILLNIFVSWRILIPAVLDKAPGGEASHQLTRAVLHPSVLASWKTIMTIMIFIIIIIIIMSSWWCSWQGWRRKERAGLDWNSINVSPSLAAAKTSPSSHRKSSPSIFWKQPRYLDLFQLINQIPEMTVNLSNPCNSCQHHHPHFVAPCTQLPEPLCQIWGEIRDRR